MALLAPAQPETVIVTDASAGVGRATALRFGETGARVGLIARDAEALDEVKKEIERLGAWSAAEAFSVKRKAPGDETRGELNRRPWGEGSKGPTSDQSRVGQFVPYRWIRPTRQSDVRQIIPALRFYDIGENRAGR